MNEWTGVFLGIIAVSVLTMALIQVGAVIFGLRIARRVDELSKTLERDVRPMLERLTAVSDDAARVSQLALAQAQRVDTLIADVTRRVDHSVDAVQSALTAPAREGMAVLRALRATISAMRARSSDHGGASRSVEEDEQMFIG